jgi:sugar O-acyltransferase (sialic acid O-acetyltransferase NeuD family)
MQDLIIVGAGGFGRETAEAVRAVNDLAETWNLIGFLDDDPDLSCVQDLPVLGPTGSIGDHPTAQVVVATGHPGNYRSRRSLVERLGIAPERYATIVHPSAAVAPSTRIGRGSVLLAHVVTTASVSIGNHVAVMPAAVFTHDNEIGDFCTVGAGARVAGRVRIDQGAYVGSGALIREDRTVGTWSLIGMGAVVIADVPPGQVWAGSPARRLRDAPLGQGAAD